MSNHTDVPRSTSLHAARPAREARRGSVRTLRRATLVAAGVAALALSVTACDNDGSSTGSQSTGSSSAASAPAGSGQASSSGGHSSSGTGSAPASSGNSQPQSTGSTVATGDRCTADNLTPSLSSADAGAGQIHYTLTLKNKGSRACTLTGFPGVSLIQRDGSTIGKPASREGGAHGSVRLAPGGTATATLHTLNQGIKGSSCWGTPAYLKIYPPGSKASLTLGTTQPKVCGDTFSTTALQG